ncbi:MAG: alpha/beta hydrolase [Polyangiaceae bacterium]|nr:alpha/beta hydrolase [Polyangiaceae bacterium]
MTTTRVDVGEVTLSVTVEGAGPPVVLLHGFPQFGYAMRHVAAGLVAAGYTAIVPDLRGYHRSDKPEDEDAYAIDHLVADVAGLLDALGHDRAVVLGHDWGGMIAYSFAHRQPARTAKLVVLNAAHPELYRQGLSTPSQLWRSWYVFFFQLPELPEALITERGYFERVMASDAPHAFPPDVVDAYVEAMRLPGSAKAAVDYYRAASKHGLRAPGTIDVETLVIWGDEDDALGRALLVGLERYVPRVRVHHLAGASHWVAEDRPAEVVAALVDFLGEPTG